MGLEREIVALYAREGAKHTAADAEIVRQPYNTIKVTSATDPGDFSDSVRAADADSFWDEYWLVGVTGANKGERRQVAAFTSVGGNFTTTSDFPNTVSVNDIFALWKPASPNQGGIGFGPEVVEIARNVLGRGLNPALPIGIVTGSTARLVAHVMGAATYPAADAIVPAPPMGDLYAACMGLMVRDKPSTFVLASGGIPTAKHENFSIGNAIGLENSHSGASSLTHILDEMVWITGKTDGGVSDDVLSTKPSSSGSIGDGERVYASATFGLATTLPRVTLGFFVPDTATAGHEILVLNCLGNFEMGQEAQQLLEVTFDFTGGDINIGALSGTHYFRTLSVPNEEPSFGPVQTVNGVFAMRNAPSAAAQGSAYVGDARDITSFRISTGNTIARKRTMNTASGVSSVFITGRNPSVTLSAYLDAAFADFADIKAGQVKDLQIQLGGNKETGGTSVASLFACRVPTARITQAPIGATDGLNTVELTIAGAQDTSEGFEDPDLGDTGLHNSPLIVDPYRFALI